MIIGENTNDYLILLTAGKVTKQLKEKTLAKEQVKEMIEKKTKSPQEAAGHNSVPSKQTTLLCIRVAHGLPPWKIVWVMFFNWVLIRHHIFWEIGHFWEFQMKETKKVSN